MTITVGGVTYKDASDYTRQKLAGVNVPGRTETREVIASTPEGGTKKVKEIVRILPKTVPVTQKSEPLITKPTTTLKAGTFAEPTYQPLITKPVTTLKTGTFAEPTYQPLITKPTTTLKTGTFAEPIYKSLFEKQVTKETTPIDTTTQIILSPTKINNLVQRISEFNRDANEQINKRTNLIQYDKNKEGSLYAKQLQLQNDIQSVNPNIPVKGLITNMQTGEPADVGFSGIKNTLSRYVQLATGPIVPFTSATASDTSVEIPIWQQELTKIGQKAEDTVKSQWQPSKMISAQRPGEAEMSKERGSALYGIKGAIKSGVLRGFGTDYGGDIYEPGSKDVTGRTELQKGLEYLGYTGGFLGGQIAAYKVAGQFGRAASVTAQHMPILSKLVGSTNVIKQMIGYTPTVTTATYIFTKGMKTVGDEFLTTPEEKHVKKNIENTYGPEFYSDIYKKARQEENIALKERAPWISKKFPQRFVSEISMQLSPTKDVYKDSIRKQLEERGLTDRELEASASILEKQRGVLGGAQTTGILGMGEGLANIAGGKAEQLWLKKLSQTGRLPANYQKLSAEQLGRAIDTSLVEKPLPAITKILGKGGQRGLVLSGAKIVPGFLEGLGATQIIYDTEYPMKGKATVGIPFTKIKTEIPKELAQFSPFGFRETVPAVPAYSSQDDPDVPLEKYAVTRETYDKEVSSSIGKPVKFKGKPNIVNKEYTITEPDGSITKQYIYTTIEGTPEMQKWRYGRTLASAIGGATGTVTAPAFGILEYGVKTAPLRTTKFYGFKPETIHSFKEGAVSGLGYISDAPEYPGDMFSSAFMAGRKSIGRGAKTFGMFSMPSTSEVLQKTVGEKTTGDALQKTMDVESPMSLTSLSDSSQKAKTTEGDMSFTKSLEDTLQKTKVKDTTQQTNKVPVQVPQKTFEEVPVPDKTQQEQKSKTDSNVPSEIFTSQLSSGFVKTPRWFSMLPPFSLPPGSSGMGFKGKGAYEFTTINPLRDIAQEWKLKKIEEGILGDTALAGLLGTSGINIKENTGKLLGQNTMKLTTANMIRKRPIVIQQNRQPNINYQQMQIFEDMKQKEKIKERNNYIKRQEDKQRAYNAVQKGFGSVKKLDNIRAKEITGSSNININRGLGTKNK
jgi:hypothetical protein